MSDSTQLSWKAYGIGPDERRLYRELRGIGLEPCEAKLVIHASYMSTVLHNVIPTSNWVANLGEHFVNKEELTDKEVTLLRTISLYL